MALEVEFLQKMVLMLGVGLIIGLERERSGVLEKFSGVRTFALGGLFGLMSAYIGQMLGSYLVVMAALVSIGLLTAFGYFAQYKRNKIVGSTTEVAFLVTFLIGVMSYFDSYPFFVTIVLSLVTTLILASKKQLHSFSRTLTTEEIMGAILFAGVTFLVLPALPDKGIGPWNAINPYRTWLSLVLVMSVGFFSYMLMKVFGANKGLFITGVLGGIASSVAVVVSMANKVRENLKLMNAATFAVLVASSIMFIRQALWFLLIDFGLAPMLLLKLAAVGAVGCFLSYAYWKKNGDRENVKVDIGSPLTPKPALKFTLVYLAVSVAAFFIKDMSPAEIFVLSFVSGLIDVDAITISLAQLSLSGLSPPIAINGMLIAAIANTMTKWVLVNWLGTKKMMFEVGRVYIFLIMLSAFLIML